MTKPAQSKVEDDKLLLQRAKAALDRLSDELNDIDKQIRLLEKQYNNDMKILTEKRKAIVSRCPHLQVKYHPDASGNNDSWFECLLCGAEV